MNDPFIDDSDLAVDERQYIAQTKQQGFYVSSGEVALLKDKYVDSYTNVSSRTNHPPPPPYAQPQITQET